MTFSPEDLKRMAWHSRRGMLELDLILVPFVEKFLPGLADEYQLLYQKLLEQEDQDLFVWLTQRESAATPELQKIIEVILNSRAA